MRTRRHSIIRISNLEHQTVKTNFLTIIYMECALIMEFGFSDRSLSSDFHSDIDIFLYSIIIHYSRVLSPLT